MKSQAATSHLKYELETKTIYNSGDEFFFSSAIIQFTFGLFENSCVLTLLAHTFERLGLLQLLRLSFILFLLLLFLFLLGLHCKRRPLPPDRTFHLRAAQSSALTNLESIFVSKSSFLAAPAQVLF